MINNYETQYLDLIKDILENGTIKEDRTGTGTISIFGRQLRHKMSEGFPLLTTRKISLKNIFTELKWFLSGDTNIKYLVDNGCNIWVGDAYKSYKNKIKETDSNGHIVNLKYPEEPLSIEEFINKIKTYDEFAKEFGDLGPSYGKQWRSWKEKDILEWGYKIGEKNIDQISNLVNTLKTNPDSRRMLVTAWNPVSVDYVVLPPCHYSFQVYTRELSLSERFELWEKLPNHDVLEDFAIGELSDDEYHNLLTGMDIPIRSISLMFNMRSNDLILGQPYNMASYSLLLLMLAKQVNMVPDEVICSLGDVHIYRDQIDIIPEQLSREQFVFPNLSISDRDVEDIKDYNWEDIYLSNYKCHPAIKYPLSN